jgi:hypothetical protein
MPEKTRGDPAADRLLRVELWNAGADVWPLRIVASVVVPINLLEEGLAEHHERRPIGRCASWGSPLADEAKLSERAARNIFGAGEARTPQTGENRKIRPR